MKPINSRYSVKNISSSSYQPTQITGSGNTRLEPGYIWAPYVMAECVVLIDYEYLRQKIRHERIEKLKKLNND